MRADLQAIFPLKGAASALGDDPNRAAQCLALAMQAGMPSARGAAALFALRVAGAPVPLGERSLDRLLEAEVAAGDAAAATALAREARAALASTTSDRAVDGEVTLVSVLLIFDQDAEARALLDATRARFAGGVSLNARPALALCRLVLDPETPGLEGQVREAVTSGRPVISPILRGLVGRLATRRDVAGDAEGARRLRAVVG